MTKPFNITAWAPNGKDTVVIEGPVNPNSIALRGDYVPWAPADKALLRERYLTTPAIADLAKLLGRTKDSVWAMAAYMGLKRTTRVVHD